MGFGGFINGSNGSSDALQFYDLKNCRWLAAKKATNSDGIMAIMIYHLIK
jgi:hypothetical protein